MAQASVSLFFYLLIKFSCGIYESATWTNGKKYKQTFLEPTTLAKMFLEKLRRYKAPWFYYNRVNNQDTEKKKVKKNHISQWSENNTHSNTLLFNVIK